MSDASQGLPSEWAIRQGWSGRPVRQEQAQGTLVAALGMLAARTPTPSFDL